METRAQGTRLLAVAVSALALFATALPASAKPNTFTYDAIGDSFAAGAGVSPTQAHPYVLDGRMKIELDDFAPVSGATVQSMLAGQLGALDAETDLVTVSIGGNNVGWIETLIVCLVNPDAQCEGAVAGSEALITTQLPGLLDAAYAQVRAAAPNAHVVVTGYPRLFSPEYGTHTDVATVVVFGQVVTIPLEATVAEQQSMNDAADLLNSTIRRAAEAHGFQFVDVVPRFRGHGVNAPDAWLFGATDPVPFHPTVAGQHAYGVALRSSINPNSLR